MTDPTTLQCPRCGGHREKDLRPMRRITGWALIFASLLAISTLAVVPWRAPWWSVAGCGVAAVMGLVALFGAGAARYCADCDVRMETKDAGQDQGGC